MIGGRLADLVAGDIEGLPHVSAAESARAITLLDWWPADSRGKEILIAEEGEPRRE